VFDGVQCGPNTPRLLHSPLGPVTLVRGVTEGRSSRPSRGGKLLAPMIDFLILSILFALVVLSFRPLRRAGATRVDVAAQQALEPWGEQVEAPRGPMAKTTQASAA
jgi:hypothetical protein